MKSSEIIRRDENGTYAKLVPSSLAKDRICSVAAQINVDNVVGRRTLHTTVIYSRVQCNPPIDEETVSLPIVAHGTHFELFDNADGSKSLVLLLDSDELHELHHRLMDDHNATYDFPEYQPHITISYDYPHKTVPNEAVIEYLQNIEFDGFAVEELILD